MQMFTGLTLATVSLSTVLAASLAAARHDHTFAARGTLRALYRLEPPGQLSASHTALVLVDFQDEFFHGRLPLPEAPRALEHAARLVRWARRAGILIVHVRNVVRRPGTPIFAPDSPGSAPMPELTAQQGDLVLEKSMAGAFSRTDLDRQLRERGVDTLILGGLMTHLAVQTTASDGMVLGYRVIVAAEATATRTLPGALGGAPVDAATVQRAALAAMADRVADVLASRNIEALPVVP